MEKNKKVLKNYVLVVGGSRGEIEDVLVVECENGMEEYLKKMGEDRIKMEFDSCDDDDRLGVEERVEEFSIGKVLEYDSEVVGKVYGVCLGEEEELYMFEGEVVDFEDFDCMGNLIDYLEI
jgi:hypothetical protein